jgi:hypothetical protein
MSTTPVNKPNTIPAAVAAIRTLEAKGYTYTEGAEQWRPPLGKRPSFMNAPPRDVWRWGGNGDDHLESMGNNMAIEITAAQLRVLLGWKDNIEPVESAPEPRAIDLLTEDHKGMRVDYSGLFKQAQSALNGGYKERGLSEMLRQLKDHLTELGQRWYAGDTAVVDELLQLYCVEKDARDALAATKEPAKPSDPEGSYRDATGELVLPVRSGWPFADVGGEQ